MKPDSLEDCAENLTRSIETVIYRCLCPVPSRPLILMHEAAIKLEMIESDEDDHPIWKLLEATHDVDWAFWPDGVYGSDEASVATDQINELVHSLQEYRRAMECRKAEAAHD